MGERLYRLFLRLRLGGAAPGKYGAQAAHLPGQGRGGKALFGPPLPVAGAGAGRVDPRFGPQLQPVCHGDDGEPGHAAQRRPDHPAHIALFFVQAQHGLGLGQLARIGGGQPVLQGGVVVGAGVHHAVGNVVVGQILAVTPRVKGKLQHLHAGQAAVGQKPTHAVKQQAQILGHDGQFAQGILQCAEQRHAGALLPLALPGGEGVGGDGPVGVKGTEVVDAQQVVQAQRVAHPADPPGVAGFGLGVPVIQGVAPQLAVGAEIVRRAARHPAGAALAVHLKQAAARPGVGRVGRDVDGNVAEDLHAPLVGVGLQGLPLAAELELYKGPEAQLIGGPLLQGGQSLGLAGAQRGGPLQPVGHVVLLFGGHVQAVVLQPAVVQKQKAVVFVRIGGLAAGHRALALPHRVGGPQQGIAAVVQRGVVHPAGVGAKVGAADQVMGEQPFVHQPVQVDKIGVARKGRAALIGAVAIAGGAQRQHLPHGLPRLGQKIYKTVGFPAETADAIGPRQAGNGHKYADGAVGQGGHRGSSFGRAVCAGKKRRRGRYSVECKRM